MRIAALDVGDARIGVAVCDELGLTTRGIGVVRRQGGVRDLEAIARLLAPLEPERIVVGLPVNMDGTEGPQAAKVRRFADRLGEHLGTPIDLWDERLTTVEAEAIMRETGVQRHKRRGLVDQVAAAGILRSYLAGRAKGS
jgi:putative pre-16S rRNA nuclease